MSAKAQIKKRRLATFLPTKQEKTMNAPQLKNHDYNALDEIETHYDAFKFLRRLCGQFGFSRFLISPLPELDETLSQLTILTNWDPELLQIYDEKFFAQRGGIWPKFQSSSVPVSVSLTEESTQRLFLDSPEVGVLKSFGMGSATWIPLRTNSRRPIIVCLGSANVTALTGQEMAELLLPIVQLGERLEQIKGSTERPAVVLSDRETECLRWTAHGKTSLEIAAILELSEHTVNHYLAGAGRKLNAVSRPHAVANALRHGLIN